MMAQHSQTNGASLEDCHTNFFALTDLCGIKWRVYVWDAGIVGRNPLDPGGSSMAAEAMEDPVLVSYGRCLSADVLCVWRRTWPGPRDPASAAPGAPQPCQKQTSSLRHSPKELWIFWYGDEPDLSTLVSPELAKTEEIRGSWDSVTGMSYECRTLVFKALHNLIERCLLTRDFVRLGRWFVQPYEGPEGVPASRSTHLSFCLSFFVHGESIVCASVDVRQHPPVRLITRQHLQLAQQSSHGIPVILGPYGLSGTLTGVTYRLTDQTTQKLMDDWQLFFPIDFKNSSSFQNSSDSSLPPVVEVIVGGHKMRYPSCYVLVTVLDDYLQLSRGNGVMTGPQQGRGVAPNGAMKGGLTGEAVADSPPGDALPQHISPFTASTHTLLTEGTNGRNQGWSRDMCERVWQDVVMCPGQQQQQVSHDALSPGGTLSPAEIAGQWDFADPATKMPCTCSKLGTPCGVNNSFSGYKGGGVTTPGSVPSLRLHGVADGPPPSVESTASVTPSPLPTPHSQPASVPHHDPSQSTLSPHGASCGEPSTPNTGIETSESKQNMSELMGIKSEPSVNSHGISPYDTNEGPNGNEGSSDNSRCMNSSAAYSGSTTTYGTPLPRGLKRPSLPGDDYHTLLEKETSSNCLYDYSKLNAWFHNPVKKFKPTEIKSEGPLWPPYRPPYMQQHMENVSRTELSENITEVNGYPMKRTGGLKRPPDPYDFDDESSVNTLETYKRKEEKEDAKNPGSVRSCHDPQSPSSREKKSGSLYTSAGLQPSYSDLDEIFDSSDSPADDGAFPDHTPPGSNKPVGGPDDTAVVKSNSNNKSSVVGLVELTKMFPTPPSHEHNPDHDSMQDDPQGIQVISIKQERIEEPKPVTYGMHQDAAYVKEEVKENSPSVYKPPMVCMYVGSPRYAPLNGLHSQKESILPLPMHCIYKPHQFFGQYSISEKGPGNNGHPGMGPMGGGPTGAMGGGNINAGGTTQTKVGMSPISPLVGPPSEGAPTSSRGPGSVGPGGPGSAGPPLNYELPSPASNQSSYLNKTLPSVEPPSIGVSQVPEANSLIVNIVLQDSSINLFRDHNFDSCTMCVCNVCNNNSKVVGNIRGNDGTLYLPPSQISCEEESIKCNCGFSAVVNRRLAFRSGLFYEDEVDLCGLHESLATERKKNSLILLVDSKGGENPERDSSILDQIPQSMFQLLQSQCLVTLSTPGSVIYRSTTVYQNTRRDILLNTVDHKDGNETAVLAVEQSRCGFPCDNGDLGPPNVQQHSDCMHKWCYFQFEGPTCSKDVVRCMKALQPFLQEAVQKKGKKVNWEPVFSVEGPLTWRQFHRMAVRGTEDMAEPLPVPMLLTGHEKDWLSIAPQSVRHWEKLLLEPYSQQRNVAYVVVAPDNEFILSHVRTFFKELSSIYELCKLGRHAPIQRVLRNGIMRVSKNAASKVANEAFDEWFSLLGDSQMCTKLKVYAQVCRHWLAPHLATLNMDKSLFEVPGSTRTTERQAPSPMPPPSSDSGVAGSTTPTRNEGDSFMSGQNSTGSESRSGSGSSGSSSGSGSGSGFGPGSSLVEVDEEECPPPAILVYLVDPFSVGQDHPDMHRLVTLGLLRCYKYMLEGLSETMQNNVYLQIVSLESILELSGESNDRSRYMEQLKSLAFSVFMQCRRMLIHSGNVRSLTGFGPAATFDSFLKPKDLLDQEKKLTPYHIFSPAYILAPFKESRGRHKEAEEALGAPREKSTILYCTYCLSEDQRWLLATATDELGEILETVTINIEIPNRTRRKKASARRFGLKKLMDWILSVMSIGVHPWRLVVGRLGRMGHGELKGWSSLLSRKSLIQASKTLKEMCKQCAYLFPGDAPCILSACLVSLEPDSSFRMMPDMFTPDERFGQNSQNCSLSTPQDITCTHILVFPTSAIAQSAQHRFQDEFHLGEDENLLLNEEDLDDGGMNDMIGMGPGGMGINFNDILGLDQGPGPDDQIMDVGQTNSLSNPSSPNHTGAHSPSHFSGQARSNGVVMVDPEEDGGQVLQQPLALGYYVSTASTGRLPRWFWSSCPHLETSCPVFLKSALHLHSAGVTQAEDFMHNSKNNVHPLDSTYTTDVLRYVLEGYNGLSWLVLDPAKQDRRSCLPIHMQVLAHLYNVMAALV